MRLRIILSFAAGFPVAICVVMIFHEALKTCLSRYTSWLLIFVARNTRSPTNQLGKFFDLNEKTFSDFGF